MSAEMTGFKELEQTLRTLGERTQRKVLRSAVSQAATPIVKAAKANANDSKESGTLKKSLGKKVKTYTATQTVVAIVGPKSDVTGMYKGELRRPANYAHLVEGGHINKDGTYVPPKPFLKPAFDATQSQAVGIIQTKLAEGITKEAAKQS